MPADAMLEKGDVDGYAVRLRLWKRGIPKWDVKRPWGCVRLRWGPRA